MTRNRLPLSPLTRDEVLERKDQAALCLAFHQIWGTAASLAERREFADLVDRISLMALRTDDNRPFHRWPEELM